MFACNASLHCVALWHVSFWVIVDVFFLISFSLVFYLLFLFPLFKSQGKWLYPEQSWNWNGQFLTAKLIQIMSKPEEIYLSTH